MKAPSQIGPLVAACCKLVDLRVEVDPLSGDVHVAPRSAGMSPADEAALEWALRIAHHTGGSVVAVSAGPPESEEVLRAALAAGAARAVRVDLARHADSAAVAQVLARALGDAAVVCCGDASLDRGTGAVPAFLAGELGAQQALGLVGLHLAADPLGAGRPWQIRVERRLDRGRREHLVLTPQCVLSVEAHTARLRRAPLEGVLAAREASIEIEASEDDQADRADQADQPDQPDRAFGSIPVRTAPFRPRSRVVAPPDSSLSARDRILSLVRSPAGRTPGRPLRLAPEQAAAVLLESLRAWGELS